MKSGLRMCISPSILSADFACLLQESKEVLQCGADELHIDIMDGHFVNNLTIGPPVVSSLRKHLPTTILDCHLMVTHPQNYVSALAKCHVDCFTFHAEAEVEDIPLLCATIRSAGMKVGVSVKPATPLHPHILKLIEENAIDKLLVMTVEPGWGGQPLILETLTKVTQLRNIFKQLDIQVDGGITVDNVEKAFKAGANCIVSGSGIFAHKSRAEAIGVMKEIGRKYYS